MIKHIFSDMDGTLLTNRGAVTPTNIKTIKNLRIPITLVSARSPMEMTPAIKALGLTQAQIAFNGGLIFKRINQKFQFLNECSINIELAASIISAISSNFPKVSVSYYDCTSWYTSKIDYGIKYQQKLTGQKATVSPHNKVLQQASFKVFKIMIITFNAAEILKIHDMLNQLNIASISIQQSGLSYLEITSIDAQKSRGIDYILTKEKLNPDETAGFGDSYNDLPMLNRVGLPIVMDNALDEIKQVAQFVTKSNEESGVAYALQTLPAFHIQ